MDNMVDAYPRKEVGLQTRTISDSKSGVEIALLTACRDRQYALGLAMALISKGILLDVIGSDEIDSPELHSTPNLHFLNFRTDWNNNADFAEKLLKLLAYYAKLIGYVAVSKPAILHILWNGKFELFDRTILMLYYKILKKRIALTAHNVNQAKRDSNDSWLNRVTLKVQYRLCDHIFVHTQEMKRELCQDFGVSERAVTVIRHPINNACPDTELTSIEAKRRLGLGNDERAILFLGKIRPYKGIEFLLEAFRMLLADTRSNYRLIIAGEPNRRSEEYLREIQRCIKRDFHPGQVIPRMQFIPDDELEVYLKGADVLVLPYKFIFQSGILLLAYTFGLPVVATDVGSFREDIIEGKTGFVCKPGDPEELAKAIERYFTSNLFKNLRGCRQELKNYASANYSWRAVADLTFDTYAKMLERSAL